MINMLKSSKSKIFTTTHDQLSNVTFKIQNSYQHHHYYYHNALFYRCNLKSKQIKRPKKRNRNRNKNRRSKKKPKTKCLNNGKSSINSYSSSNSSNSANSVANVFCCAHYNSKGCKVNFKISHQINNILSHICLYFQQNFNNLQLVIVLILLTAITTAAHKIDTQEKSQQKSTNRTSLATAFVDTASMETNNFNESLHTVACRHIPYAPLLVSAETNLRFKSNGCHNLRHIQHRHRSGQRHLHLHTRTFFKNLNLFNKSSSKWLANNTRIKFKNNSYKKQIHYQYEDNDDAHDHRHHQSESTAVINKPQKSYKNKYEIKNEIEKNKMAKEDEQHLHKINNSNISKFFPHTRTNKYYSNKGNNNYNKITDDILTVNVKSYKETRNEKHAIDDVNNHINDIDDDVDADDGDNNDGVEIINFGTSLNLLPPAASITTDKTANSLYFTRDQQQHIDHIKLMKLVMDGLGLKKVPNMKAANISQEEYATKYREYLQRVHTRKRREDRDVIGGYDEHILRPLDIFSIVSNSTLLIQQQQEYPKMYSEVNLSRQRRNAILVNNDKEEYDENDDDEDRKESLEERVRNILFLKKKYQKPRSTKKERDERKTNIRLMFALKPEILNLSSSDIEEANIRLVLIHSPILAIRNFKNKKAHAKPKSNLCGSSKSEGQKNLRQVNILNLKLYFIPRSGKRTLLDGRTVDIHVDLTKPDETHTQWLQFDVSKAIKTAIDDKRLQHVVLELQCDNCKRIGARILNDAYNTADDAIADDTITEGHELMPVLNIIGHFDKSHRSMRPHKYETHHSETNEEATTQRHYHHQPYNNNKNRHNRRTNCYKANQRCCRHSMEVTFKEIKGFEFIIQPKVFDAGYCHGRCPPRYNPAHHHALLQSLIWKQNHKAPRPCCAPSKLVELEVLHVDEKDSEKLKISTWSDMRVVECACS